MIRKGFRYRIENTGLLENKSQRILKKVSWSIWRNIRAKASHLEVLRSLGKVYETLNNLKSIRTKLCIKE